MVQDADTGNLVMVPVIRASFSQLGITRPQRIDHAPDGHDVPDRRAYRAWAEPQPREERYLPAFHNSVPEQGYSGCPRESWDHQEPCGQTSASSSRNHQDDGTAIHETTNPARGWGATDPAHEGGATDPW